MIWVFPWHFPSQAGTALQPDPAVLGQLWDGDGYGAGEKHLSLGKVLEEQQKLLHELNQTERSIAISILAFCAAAPSHPIQIHPFNGCHPGGSTYILL